MERHFTGRETSNYCLNYLMIFTFTPSVSCRRSIKFVQESISLFLSLLAMRLIKWKGGGVRKRGETLSLAYIEFPGSRTIQ